MARLVSGPVTQANRSSSSSGPARRAGGLTRNFLLAADPEWLISIGRFVTALFAVLAVYLDPTQPAVFLDESQTSLGLYVVFSLLLVVFPLRMPLDSPIHLIVHLVDAAVLGWLAFLTNELTSPFFSFLPFILLAMTIRWGLRGAILGALTMQIVLIIVGLPDLEDGESELNVFIMRATYFMVAAVMLGYFGAYREHNRQRLTQLADWPFDAITGDRASWLGGLFRHAAGVLGASCVVVVWRDQEQDIGSVAYWLNRELRLIDVSGAAFWDRHDPEHMPDFGRGEASVVNAEALSAILRDLPELAGEAGRPVRYICSAMFSSVRYRGRVFVIDPACRSDECVSLTEIVAMRFRSELERLALMQQATEAARSAERTRLARDLHDSILQDLTAASLKLKLIAKSAPDETKANVADVNALVFHLQQRIRRYVEGQRSIDQYADAPLNQTLPGLIKLLQQQWDCQIEISLDPPDIDLPKTMLHEIMQLVSEATANSIRHGKATQVRITLILVDGRLELEISDNGLGIETDAMSKRPLSLSARVSELKGNLTIGRASPGLNLLIALPLKQGAH
ncbi:histidine kinase [Rhizobium sp. LjRoot98]|uniref:sensor histidine kinase n=1 Tax=unclassified Rhizobium TaxID=2613769 RepID=UPI000712D68A|nr:histidine kinase [Rhizobium sp. Root1204]KQV38666.1 histidine kinase [Rhizobium sp. Root1204]